MDKERKTPSGAPWAPGAIAWASGFGSPLLVALAAFVIVNLLLLLLLSRFIETRAQRAEVANLALRDSFP